jgi:hypothetical protein
MACLLLPLVRILLPFIRHLVWDNFVVVKLSAASTIEAMEYPQSLQDHQVRLWALQLAAFSHLGSQETKRIAFMQYLCPCKHSEPSVQCHSPQCMCLH